MRDADDNAEKLPKFDSPTALFLNLTLSLCNYQIPYSTNFWQRKTQVNFSLETFGE